jgi:hypothetical protein
MQGQRKKKRSFIRHHSLTIVSGGILGSWIFLYSFSSPTTHLGSFFGNAIADWTGLVVMALATKYLYEKGSAESRRPKPGLRGPFREALYEHSLTIFLLITGIAWAVLFKKMDSESKWGQVVGNIVSEWTQILGLVLLTKKLYESHSKESAR